MNGPDTGIGSTNESSLRVSVATLCRVVFHHPEEEKMMLALEHKAFLDYYGDGTQVIVKAQPFGGGVRILNQKELMKITGGFNYDSKRSHTEQDFRIYIQPSRWGNLRDFCLKSTRQNDPPLLESDPTRELEEEFNDALGIQLNPRQYSVKPLGVVVEDKPAPTSNLRAAGALTARIYFTYEVHIHDPDLICLMLSDSETNTASNMRKRVLDEAGKGNKGRANAILAVALERIRETYLALPEETRVEPMHYEGTLLDGNVAAVLEGVPVPKYQRGG